MNRWRTRKPGRVFALIAGMVALMMFAVACASSEPAAPAQPAAPAAPAPAQPAPAQPAPAQPAPAAPAPSTGEQPGAGERVTVLVTNVGNGRFDTWLADGEDLKYQRLLNAGLVGGKGGSVIVPSTIKAWDMTPDGLNWTFTVQDDFVTFHNGDRLTIDDVHWSVDKMLGNQARALEAAGYYEPRDIADAAQYESVNLGPGPDQFTVTAKIPRPDVPFFISENSQGPQNLVMPKAYTLSQVQPGDKGYEGYEKAPVGAGPMMITDWVPEQKYEFERYTDYFWHPGNGFDEDRRVKFEFLTMEVVPEDATRVAALRAGDADLIEANILMLDGIEAADGWVAWQGESAYNWVVMVDCWEPDMWCYDKRVRQAVEYAIDKETIVSQLYGRGATVKGWGHVTPNALGYSPDLDPLPYDVEKAKALLAEAGIVDGKMNGEQVSFKIYTWEAGDTPLLPELSQLFADAWRENLGFDVEVVVGDASATRQQWNNRQLPGHVLVRTNEARFDGTSILTGAYNNVDIAWRAVKDPDLEPWLSTTTVAARKALNDLDPQTRGQSFNEAYKILKDDNQYWSGFYTNLPWGVSSRIKDGSYQPWTLVPYVTAIWTLELDE